MAAPSQMSFHMTRNEPVTAATESDVQKDGAMDALAFERDGRSA